MLKKALLTVAGVAMLMVAGCTDPIAANQDTFSPYPQVIMDSYSLQYDIVIDKPVATRVGAGQLRVDITVRSRVDYDIDLDYKFYFVDANGVQVEGDKAWLSKRVMRRGIETIEFTSLTASAADFRVEMRRKKFE